MEFLYKLYENQYFALGLFSVIAVLLFLFVIVLILAIKDSKNRKIEELSQMEQKDINKVKAEMEQEEFRKNISDVNDTYAFEEETPVDKVEVEQDIVFDEPTGENSMSDLLNKFEDTNSDSQDDDLEDLFESMSLGKEDLPILNNEYAKSSKIVGNRVVSEDLVDDDLELPAIKKVSDIEELADNESIIDLSDDNIPEVKVADLKTSEIDLEKTGVLDFSNIKSESYDIKKN